MKKQMRKVFAIVMALTMVFAMTSMAFAADTGVNVSIRTDGVEYIGATVSAADIAARAGSNAHLYDMKNASPQVPSIGYTAADALIQAWYKFYGDITGEPVDDYTTDQIAYGWDNDPKVGLPGLYFSIFDGIGEDGSNYLIGQREDGLYEYYWRGYTWNLSIDGVEAGQYATSYAVSDISSIVFDYKVVKSETFTLDYLIPGCPNASEDPYN